MNDAKFYFDGNKISVDMYCSVGQLEFLYRLLPEIIKAKKESSLPTEYTLDLNFKKDI